MLSISPPPCKEVGGGQRVIASQSSGLLSFATLRSPRVMELLTLLEVQML